MFYIYVLYEDKTPSLIRYVGKSVSPKDRLISHHEEARYCGQPLLSMKIIDSIEDSKDCYWLERYYIEKFRVEGHPLTNHKPKNPKPFNPPRYLLNRLGRPRLPRKHRRWSDRHYLHLARQLELFEPPISQRVQAKIEKYWSIHPLKRTEKMWERLELLKGLYPG